MSLEGAWSKHGPRKKERRKKPYARARYRWRAMNRVTISRPDPCVTAYTLWVWIITWWRGDKLDFCLDDVVIYINSFQFGSLSGFFWHICAMLKLCKPNDESLLCFWVFRSMSQSAHLSRVCSCKVGLKCDLVHRFASYMAHLNTDLA